MKLKKINNFLDRFFLLSKNRAFPELDGLRTCAILMVFMAHAGSWLHNIMSDSQHISPLSQRIYDFVRLFPLFGAEGGGVGVDIFFMLSGFLIFMTIYKSQPTSLAFLKNRLSRLMPVHTLLILAFADSHGLITLLLNFSMLVDFFPRYENINLVTWTLSYELLFYILAAIWFIRYKKSKFLQSWIFLILVSILLLESQLILTEPFSKIGIKYPIMDRFIAFIFGVALAKLYFNDKSLWKGIEKYIQLGLLPALLLFIALKYYYAASIAQSALGYVLKSTYTLLLDSTIFILFANLLITRDSFFRRILRNIYVRIIGVVSYSLYVYHYTFGLPMTKEMLSSISSVSVKMILFVPFSFLICLAASIFLFHFLEKPYFLRKFHSKDRPRSKD